MTGTGIAIAHQLPPAATGQYLALLRGITTAETAGQRLPCQTDPEAWFSIDPQERAAAAEACDFCPVIELCASYADAADERHGVWAGRDRGPNPATPRPPAEDDDPNSKTCATCQQTKPLDQYGIERRRPDGRAKSCRDCARAYDRERYRIREQRARALAAPQPTPEDNTQPTQLVQRQPTTAPERQT